MPLLPQYFLSQGKKRADPVGDRVCTASRSASVGLLEFRPAMRSWLTVTAVAALGAALLTSISAATSVPYLRAVSLHNRHVVAVFTLGDLAADHIAVASSPQTQANGAFVQANV